MKAREVLRNEHFNRLAAIIRVPFHSSEWRQEHYECDFWSLTESLDGAIEIDAPEYILETLTSLLVAITKADSNLSYSPEDFDWIVEVLEDGDGDREMVMRLFQAWYAAEDKTVTVKEAAEITGEAASTWRNRANRGEVPGARKMGKTWLLPVSSLRMMGVDIPVGYQGREAQGNGWALYVDEYVLEKGVPLEEWNVWDEAGITEHSQSVVKMVPEESEWHDRLREYARQPVGFWGESQLFTE